jgi:hypothetical protein
MSGGFIGRGFCRERGPSGALFNKITICRWPETNTDPQQRVEGASHVSPSVPAEHEFVKIALQMALSEAVEAPFARVFRLENTRWSQWSMSRAFLPLTTFASCVFAGGFS